MSAATELAALTFSVRCSDLLTDDIIESKVEAANLIGLLFQGPFDAGSAVLGKSGILEGLLLLTRSEIASYQVCR